MAAMSYKNGFPTWLLDCKEHVAKTKEWETYVEELHDVVQQQLTESHVQSFMDLSDHEKFLFMDRAVLALMKGNIGKSFNDKLSSLMDQHVNEEVSRSLMDDYPTHTKTDVILSNIEEGAVSLLRKWPDMRNKMRVCFNQPLPDSLRQLTWKLTFSNSLTRKTYLDMLSKNPRHAISPQDLDISKKCEQIINTQPTFTDLKGSIGAFYAMKAVLSYYHTHNKHTPSARLLDSDFLLVIPYIHIISQHLSRKDPANNKTVADLVEQYLTFMSSRPSFICNTYDSNGDESYRQFMNRMIEIVEERDPQLLSTIASNFTPTGDKIIKTHAGTKTLLLDMLHGVVRPIINCLFVGYLSMDTVLYIWDQYVLGMDSPGFHSEFIAVVMATQLVLLKSSLHSCASIPEMESTIAVESRKLTATQFQFEIKKSHYAHLWSLLNGDSETAMPSLDPTQGQEPHWRHLNNDMVPPYTRPEDRRRAREEREAERDRLLQQQRQAEQMKRDEEQRERSELEEKRLKSAADRKQQTDDARLDLETQLAIEREARAESERYANAEITRLKMELEQLRHVPRPITSMTTASSISRILVPPPPTAATHSSPYDILQIPHTPAPSESPTQQTNTVISDILQRLANSSSKVAHGEGLEKRVLNEQTKTFMDQHIDDLQRAKMEVHGRELSPGEYNRLSPNTQQQTSEQMIKLILLWRRDRLKNM